jgi:cereblon
VVVAREQDFVTVVGDGPQVFVNPHGLVFEIVTLRQATNLLGVGRQTTEFTWFPGYAWQVVVCTRCTAHLGWAYDAITNATPARFYGLIRSELTDEQARPGD